MGKSLGEKLESIARKEFYKKYDLEDQKKNDKFIVTGGVVAEKPTSKQTVNNKKKYCATNYMDVK